MKPARLAVDVADAFDAGDDLLADVAAFVVIDGGLVQPGFGRERLFGQFGAPAGDAGLDAQGLGERSRDDRVAAGEEREKPAMLRARRE